MIVTSLLRDLYRCNTIGMNLMKTYHHKKPSVRFKLASPCTWNSAGTHIRLLNNEIQLWCYKDLRLGFLGSPIPCNDQKVDKIHVNLCKFVQFIMAQSFSVGQSSQCCLLGKCVIFLPWPTKSPPFIWYTNMRW